MALITAPGIYDLPSAQYHGLKEPFALSSTGACSILDECPAFFYANTPQSPEFEPENKMVFDIGTSVHLLVLEPHLFDSKVVVIDAEDYKTKDAQQRRDAAWAAHKTPLTVPQLEMVFRMRDAVQRHPVASLAFQGGKAEQSIFWRDREFGCWRKTRPDYLPNHTRYMVDLKTATTANPREFERQCWNLGYYRRASYYLDAGDAAFGERPERFAWVVVAKKPPHLVSVCWADAEMLQWGALQNRKAIEIFARCQERNDWPGYLADESPTGGSFTVRLPYYAIKNLEEQRDRGDFDIQPRNAP